MMFAVTFDSEQVVAMVSNFCNANFFLNFIPEILWLLKIKMYQVLHMHCVHIYVPTKIK